MIDCTPLRRDGYALLRGAIPGDWIEGLWQTVMDTHGSQRGQDSRTKPW